MSEGKGTKRKGEGESWCWCAFGGSAETLAAAVGFTLVRVCVLLCWAPKTILRKPLGASQPTSHSGYKGAQNKFRRLFREHFVIDTD